MTTTVTTEEGQVCVFVAVDHCTSECIGIHASLSGNRFEALEPPAKASASSSAASTRGSLRRWPSATTIEVPT